jgi:hypothetical protein
LYIAKGSGKDRIEICEPEKQIAQLETRVDP